MYLLMEINQDSPQLGAFKSYRILWELGDGTARFCLIRPDKSEVYGQAKPYKNKASAEEIMRRMGRLEAKIVYLWKVPVSASDKALHTVLKGLLMDCDTNEIELIARARP